MDYSMIIIFWVFNVRTRQSEINSVALLITFEKYCMSRSDLHICDDGREEKGGIVLVFDQRTKKQTQA